MDIEDIIPPPIKPKLPDCLREWEALNVSHRPSYLTDNNIKVIFYCKKTLFNLISYVGNYLNCPAEIITFPLFIYYRFIYLAGCDIIFLLHSFFYKFFLISKF